MPRKVVATFAMTAATVSTVRLTGGAVQAAMATTPRALSTVPITYHRLALSVISTSGAHRGFQICGINESAISAPILSADTPACAS